MNHRDAFLAAYRKHLERSRELYPEIYAWPIDQLEAVYSKMIAAIDRGSFNKDSHAFRWTCKELEIKHTYKDIKKFIES